jgi:hypothetical protein
MADVHDSIRMKVTPCSILKSLELLSASAQTLLHDLESKTCAARAFLDTLTATAPLSVPTDGSAAAVEMPVEDDASMTKRSGMDGTVMLGAWHALVDAFSAELYADIEALVVSVDIQLEGLQRGAEYTQASEVAAQASEGAQASDVCSSAETIDATDTSTKSTSTDSASLRAFLETSWKTLELYTDRVTCLVRGLHHVVFYDARAAFVSVEHPPHRRVYATAEERAWWLRLRIETPGLVDDAKLVRFGLRLANDGEAAEFKEFFRNARVTSVLAAAPHDQGRSPWDCALLAALQLKRTTAVAQLVADGRADPANCGRLDIDVVMNAEMLSVLLESGRLSNTQLSDALVIAIDNCNGTDASLPPLRLPLLLLQAAMKDPASLHALPRPCGRKRGSHSCTFPEQALFLAQENAFPSCIGAVLDVYKDHLSRERLCQSLRFAVDHNDTLVPPILQHLPTTLEIIAVLGAETRVAVSRGTTSVLSCLLKDARFDLRCLDVHCILEWKHAWTQHAVHSITNKLACLFTDARIRSALLKPCPETGSLKRFFHDVAVFAVRYTHLGPLLQQLLDENVFARTDADMPLVTRETLELALLSHSKYAVHLLTDGRIFATNPRIVLPTALWRAVLQGANDAGKTCGTVFHALLGNEHIHFESDAQFVEVLSAAAVSPSRDATACVEALLRNSHFHARIDVGLVIERTRSSAESDDYILDVLRGAQESQQDMLCEEMFARSKTFLG